MLFLQIDEEKKRKEKKRKEKKDSMSYVPIFVIHEMY